MVMTADDEAEYPYPGLRPFREDEAYLFFGRGRQRADLLTRLKTRNFVAIVGTSGCGKSSLIRAGLINDLKLGLLGPGRVRWKVALMRPGNHPIANLAGALLEEKAFGPFLPQMMLRESLRRGPLGLIELLRGYRPDGSPLLGEGENLLLVIDQFEEIFRLRRSAEPETPPIAGEPAEIPGRGPADDNRRRERTRAEADAFVAMILESIGETRAAEPADPATAERPGDTALPSAPAPPPLPLWIVLTMRSDFIGESAVFAGLPEMLNEGIFLAPRLSRDQRREAIEGPARVFGGSVEPALTAQLLNDAGNGPDQLPLMQHALLRLWLEADQATARDESGEPAQPIVLKLADYQAMGGMEGVIDRDADRACGQLSPAEKRIAEVMFRLLTERGPGSTDTRRLAGVDEVSRVAGVLPGQVLRVVGRFRTRDMNLLVLSEDWLDIAHESVIRNWKQLGAWVAEEAKAAEIYRQLRAEAIRFEADRVQGFDGDLLPPRMLAIALRWRDQPDNHSGWKPGPAWAERYGTPAEYLLVEEYLKRSEDADRKVQWRRRWIRRLALASAGLLIGLVSLGTLLNFYIEIRTLKGKTEDLNAQLSKSEEKTINIQAQIKNAKQTMQSLTKLSENSTGDAYEALGRVREKLSTFPSGDSDGQFNELVRLYLDGREKELVRQNALLTSRSLAFAALNTLSESTPQEAVLLAVEAVEASSAIAGASSSVALDALRQSIADLNGLPLIGKDSAGRPVAHRSAVNGLVVGPNGQWAASGSTDGSVILWDLEHPGICMRIEVGSPVADLGLSPDGRWLLILVNSQPARLSPLPERIAFDGGPPEFKLLEGYAPAQLMPMFAANSRWLVLAGSDGKAMLWNLQALREGRSPTSFKFLEDSLVIYGWAMSPDGRWLCLVEAKGTVQLWQLLEDGPIQRPVRKNRSDPATLRNVTFSEDGRRIAATYRDGRVHIIEPEAEGGPEVRAIDLAVDRLGQRLPSDPDANSTREVVATDADGRYVVVVQPSEDGSASDFVLWDVGGADHEAIPRRLSDFPSLLGSQDIQVYGGRDLIARSLDGSLWAWNLEHAQPILATIYNGHPGPIRALAFEPRSRKLFTAGLDNPLRAWELPPSDSPSNASPRPAVLMKGHDRPVAALGLAGSADFPKLVTGGGDSEVRLWDLRDFPSRISNEPRIIRGHRGWDTVTRVPGGKWMAVAADGEPPRLWDICQTSDVAGWSPYPPESTRHPLAIPPGVTGSIDSFVTTADGNWLLANLLTGGKGSENAVLAWSLKGEKPNPSGRRIGPIEGRVASASASADGRWLALHSNVDGRPGSPPTGVYLAPLDETGGIGELRKLVDRESPQGIRASSISFDPDSHWLVMADAEELRFHGIRNTDPDREAFYRFIIPNNGLKPEFSKQGGWLGFAGRRGSIQVWQIGSRPKAVRTIPGSGSPIRQFAFDPTGRRIFVRDSQGGAWVSSVEANDQEDGAKHWFDLTPQQAKSVAMSRDGRWVAWIDSESASNRVLGLLDLSVESDMPTPRKFPLSSLTDSEDPIEGDPGASGVAFSAEGRLIVIGGGMGWLIDPNRPLDPAVLFQNPGSSIAWAEVRDETELLLMIAGADNNVRIWNLARNSAGRDRRPIVLRHGESASVSASISPDRAIAVTMIPGSENVARFWRLKEESLRVAAREAVGRNLTPTEVKLNLPGGKQPKPTFLELPVFQDEPFAPTQRPSTAAPTLNAKQAR
ncbi:MAG: hypothetical protein U0800_02845 [Isosphaeraceae bacterium]